MVVGDVNQVSGKGCGKQSTSKVDTQADPPADEGARSLGGRRSHSEIGPLTYSCCRRICQPSSTYQFAYTTLHGKRVALHKHEWTLEDIFVKRRHHTKSTRTDSRDSSANMTQNWGLCVAHLTLDRNLRLHVHMTKPSPHNGDDCAWDDKYGSEIHHSDILDQHSNADLDEPREGIGYGTVHWKTGYHFTQAPKTKKKTYRHGCPE